MKLEIKWGKETFSLEIDSDKTVADLEAALYGKTRVPPSVQKLLGKGNFKALFVSIEEEQRRRGNL